MFEGIIVGGVTIAVGFALYKKMPTEGLIVVLGIVAGLAEMFT